MKILLLTYYFPPLGGAGVQRALKFAKYLPEFGCTPVVIAADEPGYVTDASLLDEVPAGTEVYRFRHVPVMTRLMHVARSLRKARQVIPDQPAVAASPSIPRSSWRDTMLNAYQALQIPDDKSGWGGKAYKQAVALIEQGGIDLIFSSSPPITSHFVAAKLKQRFGIPWVADFRDLWTTNPAYEAPAWRAKIDRRQERRLLALADGVTGVTREMAKTLGMDVSKGVETLFLPNGYDEADFSGIAPKVTRADRFVLLYMGTLYGSRSPDAILAAARRLFERRPEFANRLCLRFIGNIGSRFEPLFAAFDADYPGVIERVAYIRHGEVPGELLAADVLLLLIGGGAQAKGVLTGKVFEYLRAARPILLLGPPDGEAAQLLAETGRGITLDEEDTAQIASALENLMNQAGRQAFPVDDSRILRYERRDLTRQLADFFSRVKEGRQHV